jgi:predicted DNA binding protein
VRSPLLREPCEGRGPAPRGFAQKAGRSRPFGRGWGLARWRRTELKYRTSVSRRMREPVVRRRDATRPKGGPAGGPAARTDRVRRLHPRRRTARGPTISCRLRVTLPDDAWMAALTRSHPSLRVEVVDRLEISPHKVLFDIRLPSRARTPWGEELGELAGVETVELIDANPQTEVYRVLFTGRTFVPLVKRLRVLRRFPFPVQDGVATWIVVGPEARVRSLIGHLRRSHIAFRVDAVHQGLRTDLQLLLTSRQREVLTRAVQAGYFEVPRRISLTELAARLGVAASTLSVTLAVIEKKLVEPIAAG